MEQHRWGATNLKLQEFVARLLASEGAANGWTTSVTKPSPTEPRTTWAV